MTNFSDMLSKAKAMQDKMKDVQEQIKKIEVEGFSGGDLVKVTLTGDYEIKSIKINEDAKKENQEIINDLIKLKVKIKLITDGDVSGALLVTDDKFSVDLFLGIGGGPEGVLAAAALDAYECFFQGRFLFKTEKDKNRAKKMGIKDFDKKYELEEIVSGDSIFCATGITSGELVSGIKLENNELGGAILDVFSQEPIPKDSNLWDTPNLIITPHISSDSKDNYIEMVLKIFFKNLKLFLENKELYNQIDRKLGY